MINAALQPLVSIVLATYNGENFLGRQMDSILNQTYPNLEIIVVDDKAPIVVNAPANKPAEIKTTAPAITKRVMTDSIKIPAVYVNKSFTLQPDKPHYVAMILDKVDGVYVNEAKNAFSRYNRENYFNKAIAINKDMLDKDKTLLVFATFADAAEAISYYDKIKKAAATEVSWLQPNKYSFLVISAANLQVLKSGKDINAYKILLNNQYPGKF